MSTENGAPTLYDLFVTTSKWPRRRLFDLPYGLEVICSRTNGWQLWNRDNDLLLASEFDSKNWLVLDVKGEVICDSRNWWSPKPPSDEDATEESASTGDLAEAARALQATSKEFVKVLSKAAREFTDTLLGP